MRNNQFASFATTARALALSAALLPATLLAGANIVIVNFDGPGEGFNDPTPATPVGGNSGTTVGEQRLIAFQHAAAIWGAQLDSAVEIRIRASFDPLTCSPSSGVLGSAGTIQIFGNFPGATRAGTWHHAALANKLAGVDLAPGAPGSNADDLVARFNSDLGKATCLAGSGWYYGLDSNGGAGKIDLVTVLLHEFAHGLGFANFVDEGSGSQPLNLPDVYSVKTLDLTTGKTWDQMTNAERVQSAINSRRVAWTGANVTAAVPSVLQLGTPLLTVSAPSSVAGVYPVGSASFGPALTATGVTGQVVLVNDGVGTTSDGCSAFAGVAGKIALIDRGTCAFTIKVKAAQDAGAIAVIIADNAAGGPPAGMSGTDASIVIPSVRITLADGNTLKAALGSGVVATLGVNLSVRAGADPLGRALLNAPSPVQPGSSISHFDPLAIPNQLMEPSINSDLTHRVSAPADLSLALLRDVGWYKDSDLDQIPDETDCEPNSDLRGTVFVGACDSGVPNTHFTNGCTIADLIRKAASQAKNHGQFVRDVATLTNALVSQGLITGKQKGAIQTCAAQATLPLPQG